MLNPILPGMATAANQASTATSNAAKMIQENVWGRSGGVEDRGKHMAEWQQFFGVLPHHNEHGLNMADEHHGEDHNTHYFDHGEHGTGTLFIQLFIQDTVVIQT